MTDNTVGYWDADTRTLLIRDMTPEEIVQREADIAIVVAPVVPQSVTRRQARQALLIRGYLDAVPVALAGIPDPLQRGLAQIEWADSLEFERNRPLVVSIGTAMGLDLDELFIFAATL